MSDITEFCIVEMTRKFYEANESLLKEETKLKSAYIRGEDHKGDEKYKELLNKVIEAQTELREYEFEKRYKINKLKSE